MKKLLITAAIMVGFSGCKGKSECYRECESQFEGSTFTDDDGSPTSTETVVQFIAQTCTKKCEQEAAHMKGCMPDCIAQFDECEQAENINRRCERYCGMSNSTDPLTKNPNGTSLEVQVKSCKIQKRNRERE